MRVCVYVKVLVCVSVCVCVKTVNHSKHACNTSKGKNPGSYLGLMAWRNEHILSVTPLQFPDKKDSTSKSVALKNILFVLNGLNIYLLALPLCAF